MFKFPRFKKRSVEFKRKSVFTKSCFFNVFFIGSCNSSNGTTVYVAVRFDYFIYYRGGC